MENNFSIFSDETLDSLSMAEIMGGGEDPTINNCYGGNCGNCAAGCGCTTNECPSNPAFCWPPTNPFVCL